MHPVHGESCSDFGPDEATTDDSRGAAFLCCAPQRPVVVESAEIDNPRCRILQLPGRATGSKEKFAIGVHAAFGIADLVRGCVDRRGTLAEVQDGPKVANPAKDALFVLALPERFGKRRAIVGRVRFVPDHADGIVRPQFPDRRCSCCGRHSSADDKIVVVRHSNLLVRDRVPDGPVPGENRMVEVAHPRWQGLVHRKERPLLVRFGFDDEVEFGPQGHDRVAQCCSLRCLFITIDRDAGDLATIVVWLQQKALDASIFGRCQVGKLAE